MAEQQRTGNERAAASDAGFGADAAARPKNVLAAARRAIEQRGLANAETPVLLMVSNGKGTGFGQEQWRHYATSFAKGQKNMEVTYYDSPHYFYHYQTKEVIRSIEEFIQETTD